MPSLLSLGPPHGNPDIRPHRAHSIPEDIRFIEEGPLDRIGNVFLFWQVWQSRVSHLTLLSTSEYHVAQRFTFLAHQCICKH